MKRRKLDVLDEDGEIPAAVDDSDEWTKPWQPRTPIYQQESTDRLGWMRWLWIPAVLLPVMIWLGRVTLAVLAGLVLLAGLGVGAAIWVYDVRRLNRYHSKVAVALLTFEGQGGAELEYSALKWWGLRRVEKLIKHGSPEWAAFLAEQRSFRLSMEDYGKINLTALVYPKLHTTKARGRVYTYRYWHAHLTGTSVRGRPPQFHRYIGRDDALTVDRLRKLSWECHMEIREWDSDTRRRINHATKGRKRRIHYRTSMGRAILRHGTEEQKDKVTFGRRRRRR